MKSQTESKAPPTRNTSDEASVKALITQVADAVGRQDADGIAAAYSEDAVIFDVRDSLQHPDLESFRKYWEECFEMVKEYRYQLHDLKINVDQNLAFSTALCHIRGVTKDGEKIEHWLRLTNGFKKLNDEWQVVHEHISIPGQFETGRILSLKPGEDLKH